MLYVSSVNPHLLAYKVRTKRTVKPARTQLHNVSVASSPSKVNSERRCCNVRPAETVRSLPMVSTPTLLQAWVLSKVPLGDRRCLLFFLSVTPAAHIPEQRKVKDAGELLCFFPFLNFRPARLTDKLWSFGGSMAAVCFIALLLFCLIFVLLLLLNKMSLLWWSQRHHQEEVICGFCWTFVFVSKCI